MVLAAALIGWWAWREGHAYAAAANSIDHFDQALRLPAAFLAAAVVAAVAARWAPQRLRPWAAATIAVLVAVQSTLFVHQLMPLNSRQAFYPQTPTHRFLEERLGQERYASAGGTLYPATSDYYHLRTPVGHAFTQPSWMDLLTAVDPSTRITPTFTAFPNRLPLDEVAANPILDQLSVSYWVTPPKVVPGSPTRLPAGPLGDPVRLGNGDQATCTVPGGPLRGIQVQLPQDAVHPTGVGRAQVHVRVSTPGGSLTGAQALLDAIPRQRLRIAVPGESLAGSGTYDVSVWFTGLRGGDVAVAGTATGDLACQAVRPDDDGMRLVFTEAGANVWRRPHPLPRIRWAGHSEVVPDRADRVARMSSGVPDDTVLLNDQRTPAADHSTASVDVVHDEGESITVDVSADGNGYLVVGDAIARPGWTATIDSAAAPIVAGNHAFAAVPVPDGHHRVTLTYSAPGLRTGMVVSAAALVVMLVLLVLPVVRRRRRRTPEAAAVEPPSSG